MQFTRLEPPQELNTIVEYYWIAEGNDPTPVQQKIIPDGFPEIIFHFGDPYKVNLTCMWEVQEKSLLAGQITKFFYLENTGKSHMLGIKLKPAAIHRLFGVEMNTLNDQVVDLHSALNGKLDPLEEYIRASSSNHERIESINKYLGQLTVKSADLVVENALTEIFNTHGMVTVSELCELTATRERQLQRLFKKEIGLSPKFYSRIIRFNYIFHLAQEKKLRWSEVGLEAGFYDQPHFIKNFKSFTGEDPTGYFFDEPNLANFFLKKV
jgi:AraC-like DNA-binding protein